MRKKKKRSEIVKDEVPHDNEFERILAQQVSVPVLNQGTEVDPFVIGYMSEIEFSYELGSLRVPIYPTPTEAWKHSTFIDDSGMVEVEVRFRRMVPSSEWNSGNYDDY